MSKKRTTASTTIHELKSLALHGFWMSAWTAFLSIAVGVAGLLVSVGLESKSVRPEILFSKPLNYFVGGMVLLGFIVVAIAGFIRRRNRGTIILKRRLSEIYLAALRSSAFNPQLESRISDD